MPKEQSSGHSFTGSLASDYDRYLLGLALGLAAIARWPFLATRHIQEDAYIHWRHALNWVQTGIWGFNPGEMLNGSTSPAYVLQSAFFMRLVGPDFGPTAIQISNVALTMIGVFLAWRAVPGRRVLALRGALLLCLLALSPPALLISYAGMETALLIILLGGLLKGVVEDLSVYSIAAALLLPWVRIDSIVFTGCLAAAMWIASPAARRTATLLVTTQLVATGLALGVHQFYFGQPLPQSIIGKFTTYQPVARSLSLRLHGVREALSQVFCPFDTHYLKTPWVVVTLAIAGACIVLVWALLRWRDGDSNGRFLALGIPGWIVLPILAYGSSSYVFAWYLWPSAFFFFLVATDLLGRLLASRRGVWVSLLVVAAGLLMFSGQLVLAYQNGAEEYRYRREVGLWIRDNSPPSASILLEPIGYIGYFSNRYIHDWTGLISPSVVAYRRLHGSGWMPAYLEDFKPEFVVLAATASAEGSPAPRSHAILGDRYANRHIFQYRTSDLTNSRLGQWFLEKGSAADYWIYERRPD